MLFLLLNNAEALTAEAFDLPNGYAVEPIKVWSGAHTGNLVLPPRLKTSAPHEEMWDFLAALPVVDIAPSDTWPLDE